MNENTRLARRLEIMPLSLLKPHPKNPKKHADVLIAASLKRFGYVEPVTICERTGLLASGHGRRELLVKMRDAGEAPPADVELLSGGEWGVLVNRGWSSKDDVELEALLVAANAIGEQGGWHAGMLDKLLLEMSSSGAALEQLVGTGYGKSDVDRILAEVRAAAGDDDDDFEIPPLSPSEPAPWVGEGLYQLGPHRLMVGDSLQPESRAQLFGKLKTCDAAMADPPYAIYGSSSGVGASIADGKMVLPFFESYWRGIAERLKEFGHSYTWNDWRSWSWLARALERVVGLELKNGLTWDKGGSGLGSNYANTTEWVMFVHRLEPQKAMKSVTKHTGIKPVHKPNIFRANRPHGEERPHNAAKPVSELREWVKASTDSGGVVWDPFAGGGSTLVACEREGRVCLTGEIDLRNAQITIERWQKVTGGKAVKL